MKKHIPFLLYIKRYNDILLQSHVALTKNYLNIRPLHYFNDIAYTPWPYYIGLGVFFFLLSFIMGFKQLELHGVIMLISFVSLVLTILGWFGDMFIESVVYGKYNRKIRQALNYGFILFLVSEVFLFMGFFWGYFDRLFDPVLWTGGNSLPYGIEPLYKSIKPIFATFLLICSGFFVNLSYVSIKYSWVKAMNYSSVGIILGGLFLYIQFIEYSTLLFTIEDSVFSSSFYMLTGFHGFHVIVGLLFLLIEQERLYNCHFNREKQQGYFMAVMYWHFVDYIWIFLFLSLYITNWSITYYYLNLNNEFDYVDSTLFPFRYSTYNLDNIN